MVQTIWMSWAQRAWELFICLFIIEYRLDCISSSLLFCILIQVMRFKYNYSTQKSFTSNFKFWIVSFNYCFPIAFFLWTLNRFSDSIAAWWQQLKDNSWRTVAEGQQLEDCSWRTSVEGEHLKDSSWRTAGGAHQLNDSVWRTAAEGHQLKDSI